MIDLYYFILHFTNKFKLMKEIRLLLYYIYTIHYSVISLEILQVKHRKKGSRELQ